MDASHRARQRAAHKPIVFVMLVVIGTVVSGYQVSAQQAALHNVGVEQLPSPLPFSGSKLSSSSAGADVMLRDRKKSLADNEVFDGTTKGQLDLLLSELREVRTEIREARQEHGRLASGVAEISDQVKVISDRKDQIKKKIRKLTKTLSKKDHHRKVKSGLRSLQQDHERILQAMSKAKLLNRTSNRRNNNRTNNHHNHTNNHHNHTRNNKCKDDNSTTSDRGNSPNGAHPYVPNGGRGFKRNNNNQDEGDQEEVPENDIPVVLPIEMEKKTSMNRDANNLQNTVHPNHGVASSLNSAPTPTPSTTTSSTTTTPATTTTPTTTTPKPTSEPLPANCYEVLQHGNWTSGVYTIQPGSLDPMKVWCDQRTDGGGWTVVVARKPQQEQEDFARPWEDYRTGFGGPEHEHWIGLESLHQLTKDKRHELRVNITDWQDKEYQAQWKEFTVGSEERSYKLSIGRYASSTSTAGDALKWHNSMKFSTVDRDNDALMGGHCARQNQGGWWYRGYRGCYQAHPTGIYQHLPETVASGNTNDNEVTTAKPETVKKVRNTKLGPFIYWVNWRGSDLFPKTMFLMIRPGLN